MKKLVALLVGILVTFTGHAAAQTPVEVFVYDACYPYYWGADIWEWAMTCDSYLRTSDDRRAPSWAISSTLRYRRMEGGLPSAETEYL
jgi:hypothetical protein